MDDEAILAGLDGEPDGFAVFYRRHVAALLDYFIRSTQNRRLAAELCAETFAAALQGAHRYDPEREPAAAWLYAIADGLLAQAERTGRADGRARRRLGMAPLDTIGAADFVDALEEEVVAAA